MAAQQEYFWACILEDGTLYSEFNPDGPNNDYMEITPQMRAKTNYFGLTNSKQGYFFDLTTGEFHFRGPDRDVKQGIVVPYKTGPLKVTGPMPEGQKVSFYQYKGGYTEFDVHFKSTGNIIEKHIIGYTRKRTFDGLFLDVKLTVFVATDKCPEPQGPQLDITLRSRQDGPALGVHTINV